MAIEKISNIFYPPEWSKQKSIWLSFPHNQNEWLQVETENPLKEIQDFYKELIEKILDYQDVNLLLAHDDLINKSWLESLSSKKYNLIIHNIPNNDIWIRDYGPFFVKEENKTKILDFQFNAWGEKFPPWDLDNQVPLKLSQLLSLEREVFDVVLEGGALEFNGTGVIMTTKQCLLNKNRNPNMSQNEIESLLKKSFNIEKVIWLERGLEGDHTDGHIDDFARFVSENKILLCQTEDKANPNYQHLRDSKKQLEELGYELDFLPLPQDMHREGEYLPASYANFIFLNDAVVMPIFNCAQDALAKSVFTKSFPSKDVITIDSSLLIQEGGGLHCMTKQEPA
jgi:agmatine deiminase